MVASINYMDRFSRERYFREVRRVLRDNGLFIITCTNKVGGFLKALVESDGEKDLGLSREYIVGLAVKNKYEAFHVKQFNFCLNNLFVFQKGPIENSTY
jgi:SAM-dependent methyltransferase